MVVGLWPLPLHLLGTSGNSGSNFMFRRWRDWFYCVECSTSILRD